MGKKNDNTLVKNASFLMIAALLSKIIGMLYKSPLSNTDDRFFQHSAGSIQDYGRKAGF